MIGTTEMSEKRAEFKDLADQYYTDSKLSASWKRTGANQHSDEVGPQRRLKKWRLIAAIIDWRRCLRKNPQEVKRRIRHGIPDWFRALVWQLISGSHEILSEKPAVDYAQLSSYEMSEFEKLCIVKDIPRTLKAVALSQSCSGSLYNVLKAYDVYDESRAAGYNQGMSYIAGLLLHYMNEAAAFWTMVAILGKPAMRGIYAERQPLLEQYLFQFGMLVKENLPRLNQHFDEQRILPTMYARRWFLTVFSADLPIPLVVRIWDIFLYEGVNTIFQMGLALLKFFEKFLLILTKERLIQFLLTLKIKRGLNPDVLLPMALSFKVQKRLPELEMEYRRRSVTLQEFLIYKKYST